MTMIRDARGTTEGCKVDSLGRLHTHSISIPIEEYVNRRGDAYNINTGEITLTNATNTPVMYIKNNEAQPLIITAIAVGLGPSTGGSGGIPKITVVKNPTAGTIVSGETDVDINSNRNFGSALTLSVNAYKGATGDTMTDGTDHLLLYQTPSGRLFANIGEVIPNGSSIGVRIQPQTSNTSMTCYVALICHVQVEAFGDD